MQVSLHVRAALCIMRGALGRRLAGDRTAPVDLHWRAVTASRALEHRIENELAKRILAGEFGESDIARVDYTDGEYRFDRGGHAEPSPQPKPEHAIV